jgi:hypothetical protein
VTARRVQIPKLMARKIAKHLTGRASDCQKLMPPPPARMYPSPPRLSSPVSSARSPLAIVVLVQAVDTRGGKHDGPLSACPLIEPTRVPRIRQRAGDALVKFVTAMLWMCGRGRPWGLVWCSKEATTHCWGLTGENRVKPVPCMNSSTA